MLADSEILHLLKVSLETKELLPEYSGIYYVVDENKIVWYVGKAKNIRKRWQGKAHHRIYQLKQLKHKYFNIYYESVDLSKLEQREQQQIAKYTPHLNNSPVKSKKVRPTETLLRETIAKISDFAFILGIEPPRKKIKDKISLNKYNLGQKKILDSIVIHICIDLNVFYNIYQPESREELIAIKNQVFTNRKKYSNKWEQFSIMRHSGLSRHYIDNYCKVSRLFVNGYVIEITDSFHWISDAESKFTPKYQQTTLARESIKVLTPKSLAQLQQGLNAEEVFKLYLQRLVPYTSDSIKLFFNESINHENAKNELIKVSQDYKLGKRGIGSRSKVVNIDSLLTSRGINTSKYPIKQVNCLSQDRMGVYVQCFSVNLKTSPHYATFAKGIIKNEETNQLSSQFEIVYLLASIDKKAWLLVEEYLKDLAKATTKLNNGEGYVEKFYISPRKYIVPAKVNIKLEDIGYSAWIPFGMNEQYATFEAAKEEIKTRLYNADLPGLKLTFKKESVAK